MEVKPLYCEASTEAGAQENMQQGVILKDGR